jgi:DNA uptake protein ComE-like DNA-binding protein
MHDRLDRKFDLSLDNLQIRICAVLVIIGVLLICWKYAHSSSDQSGVVPEKVSLANELIDPNTASYASLRRLPGVGDMRARAIINYRQKCEEPPAFKKPADFKNVPGIGPGTLNAALPLMIFPEMTAARK